MLIISSRVTVRDKLTIDWTEDLSDDAASNEDLVPKPKIATAKRGDLDGI